MIIAIDGPAAAGKGTLSRRIAETYGFHHLDTGLTYRATAKALLDAGLPLDDEAVAERMALAVELAGLDRDILSAHEIGEAASKIAVMPAVRRALVEAQRAFSKRAPGTVLDGRDIGTVICPQAGAKLWVDARLEVRALRRHKELLARGIPSIYDAVLRDMRDRDARDAQRAAAPMLRAPDAFALDTSDMDADQAYAAALAFVRSRSPAGQ